MATKTFLLHLIDGHAIIEENENIILIDTGSPVTIHQQTKFNFMSTDFSVNESYAGITISSLCEMLGTRITTLLGMDCLLNFKIIFDYPNNSITFSNDKNLSFEGESVVLKTKHKIPVIDVKVNQHTIPCFFDTGAKISYLKAEETQNLLSLGEIKDFYPSIGVFQSPSFKIMSQVGSRIFPAVYGNLPQKYENQLLKLVGQNNGILGYDFLKKYKIYLHASINDFKIADSVSEKKTVKDDVHSEPEINHDFDPDDPFRDPHPGINPRPKSDLLLMEE